MELSIALDGAWHHLLKVGCAYSGHHHIHQQRQHICLHYLKFLWKVCYPLFHWERLIQPYCLLKAALTIINFALRHQHTYPELISGPPPARLLFTKQIVLQTKRMWPPSVSAPLLGQNLSTSGLGMSCPNGHKPTSRVCTGLSPTRSCKSWLAHEGWPCHSSLLSLSLGKSQWMELWSMGWNVHTPVCEAPHSCNGAGHGKFQWAVGWTLHLTLPQALQVFGLDLPKILKL